MKGIRRRSILILCILIAFIASIGYFIYSFYYKNYIADNVLPSELPDDENIIIITPENEEKKETIVDKLFDKLGIASIEDDEIPLASSSFNARDVGMIPNDKSKALHNANILVKTLNANGRIVIDDIYYIATPTELLSAQDIEIMGTEDAEILTDNGYNTKLFDPALIKRITIRNVKFTNKCETTVFLIVCNENKIDNKVENVDIQDCTFTGNISLYRQYGNTDLDPDKVDFGIGNFIFRNNSVSNTKFSFIVLFDTPAEYCEIVGNTVRNFTYKFFNLSISYNKSLYDHISYLKVENNEVICDDEWWGETSSGSYYTFILFEGNEVLYNNNYVEGMKTRKDFAVYDAYLNAHEVNYTNNTWKNNICFASGKVNNVLLKSKGGGVRPLVRNYVGNKFIVEEDFAEKVGQSKDKLYVYFMSLTQYAESYNIRDNIFDVYDLRFPASSMPISKFSFTGNTVKAKKSSGNLAIVKVGDNNDVDSVDISDNVIELGTKADNYFNLIKMVNANKGSNSSIRKITVTNNKISAPFGYVLYDVNVNDITFINNTIIDNGSEYPGFAYSGKFNKSMIKDNSIASRNSITFFEGRQIYGEGEKSETLNITRNNYASGNNGMQLDLNYRSDTPTTYKRSYTFDTDEGTYEFYYTFTLSYNPVFKCAEVTFTNSKGETNTYKLGDDDKSSNGNGQYIELVGQNGNEAGNIPFRVRFFNNDKNAGFYISEYNSNYAELKIETTSYKSSNQSDS